MINLDLITSIQNSPHSSKHDDRDNRGVPEFPYYIKEEKNPPLKKL